jgi:hypothetical protein
MILAIILLSGLSSAGFVHPNLAASGQSTAQSTATSPPANGVSQQTGPSSSTSSAAKPAPNPSKTVARTHKKKVISADCTPKPTPTSGAVESAATPTSVNAPASVTTQTTSTSCPPKKKIVTNGGTSEPSIQLEGGSVGTQANEKKDSANQMLGVTEQNLKKLDGRQLTVDQQNTVSQARQFMDQSRKAIEAGDFDRASTLAWKAQLLSEDLIKPEK